MVNVSCTLCQVSCSSLKTLSQHVVGKKHRTSLVAHGSIEELEQVGQLQYFINTQMKEWSILGLEYVVERKSDASYIYTCRLCDVKQDCHGMVGHITDVEHVQKYIYTEHRDLYDTTEYPNKTNHLQKLEKVAKMTNISVESSACSQDLDTEAGLTSVEGRNKNCTLPSVGDDLQTKNEQEGPTNNAEKEKLECSKSNNTNYFFFCKLCCIICPTPLTLCEHLFHITHQKHILLTTPQHVKQHESLGFLLHTYLQEVPILGLEYILELKVGSLYRFSCQLCGVECNVQKMVAHMLDVYHTELYIKKHHGNLLPPKVPGLQKSIRLKALQDVAEKILKNYGRKEILLRNIPVDDSTMVKPFPGDDTKSPKASEDKQGDMSLYDNQSSSKRRLSPCSESNSQIEILKKSAIDGPSLAKRSRISPEDDKDVLPHISGYNDPHLGHNESQMWMTLTHVPGLEGAIREREPEFRRNDQLLEYFTNFVIKDYEDATFIHKISKNCINALKERFIKLKSMQKPEAPFSYISGTYQETPNISVSITESHSSGFKAFPKDASNPSRIPKNEATDISRAILPEHASNPPLGIPKIEATKSKVIMPKHVSNTPVGISQNKSTDIPKATLPKHELNPPLGTPQNEATDFSKGTLAKHDSSAPLGVPQNKANDLCKVNMPKHTSNNPVGTSQNISTDDSKATLPKHELNPPLGTPQNKATNISKVNMPKHASNSSLGISQNKSTDVSKATLPKQTSNHTSGIPQNEATDFSKGTLAKHDSSTPLGVPQNKVNDLCKVNMPKHTSNPPVGISLNKSTDVSKATSPKRALNPPLGTPQNKATGFSKVNMPKHVSDFSLGISEKRSTDISKATLSKHALNPPLGPPQNKATDFSKVNMPKHASNPSLGISEKKNTDVSKATLPKHVLNPPLGTLQNKATNISKVNMPKHASNPLVSVSQNKATDISKATLPKPALHPPLGNPQNKATDVSKATLTKQTLKPPLGIPQNEATDLFFNAIKNMSEYEVVAIFEKIATMNPEFQGMNIPTVIRFLKGTGRLKTS